ncbi:MAG: hypothetical protein ABIF08_03850 [Nanoarchaeota archaeon]
MVRVFATDKLIEANQAFLAVSYDDLIESTDEIAPRKERACELHDQIVVSEIDGIIKTVFNPEALLTFFLSGNDKTYISA